MILELDNKNRHDTFFEKEDNITIVGRLEEFNLNLGKKVTCLFPVQTLISFGNLGVFFPTSLSRTYEELKLLRLLLFCLWHSNN